MQPSTKRVPEIGPSSAKAISSAISTNSGAMIAPDFGLIQNLILAESYP